MNIIYGLGRIPEQARRPAVVTIGVFDGVHRGHQFVLRRVAAEAARKNLNSAVVTFSVHPSHLLDRAEKTPHVMSLKHKLHYIAEAGIKTCYVLKFNRSLASVTPERFVENILLRRMGMVSLYVGEDFVFGLRARGDVDFLKKKSREKGFSLHVLKPLVIDGDTVSSTLVRRLICSGQLGRARKFLGRPVSLLGRVIRGEGRGRLLGFPTANISPEHEVLVPDGIYAAWAFLGKKIFPAAAYLGTKPTFHKMLHRRHVEIFALHTRRNFYGRTLEVRFVRKIRDDRTFPDAASLSRQIVDDIKRVERILSSSPAPRPAIVPF
ncbi:MAG: riboflavin biosynthesis protein RibF [Candidatus Omnitrophota bacterium]